MPETNKESIVKYTLTKLSEAPKLAKIYTEVDGKLLDYRRIYSRIKKHMEEFLTGIDLNKRLVIIPGLRGTGKTTILFQLYNYLINRKVEQDRILYFSVDELKSLLGGKTADIINAFVQDIHRTSLPNLDKNLFIFIDEAHFDKEWSQIAKIVYDQSKKVFLIVTGSSALDLELSVDTARRAKKEAIFPMNFSEYMILRYKFFPPSGTAESIRELIFNADSNSLQYASKNNNELTKKLISIGKSVEKEFEDFICFRGFPFGLHMSQIDVHQRIFDMVDRVIEKDVFSLKSFSTETKNIISRILTFLASQTPGGTSDVKLAERLKTSPTLIRSILDVLEKTHLIFSVKPYGGSGKVVRKPWKYYFLSSSVNAAIRFKLGIYDIKDTNMLGILTENSVASYLLRLKETMGIPNGIFYDSEKEGVDFVTLKGNDVIPIEVRLSEENGSQIRKAIKKYGSHHGVLISGRDDISIENKVVYIPIRFFSFV